MKLHERLSPEKLEQLRKKYKISKGDLAYELGVSNMTLYRWLNKKCKIPILVNYYWLVCEKLDKPVVSDEHDE